MISWGLPYKGSTYINNLPSTFTHHFSSIFLKLHTFCDIKNNLSGTQSLNTEYQTPTRLHDQVLVYVSKEETKL